MDLTEAQLDAYVALDKEDGKTARQLRIRVTTLDSLVKRGLAVRTIIGPDDMLHPRDRFVYRKVVL